MDKKREIRKLYIKHLNREPDANGLNMYLKKMHGGMTIKQIAIQIKSGTEYRTKHNSTRTPNVQYITPEEQHKEHMKKLQNVEQTLKTDLHEILPLLTENDIKLFDKYLDDPSNKFKKYFEFGSGNSTLYTANKATVAKVFSVENDRKWYRRILNTCNKKITIQYTETDSGLKNFGRPTKIDKMKFQNYFGAYKTSYNCHVIMIDGRFRVSCALDIIDKINENVIVLFDDFNNRLKKYEVVLKYFDVIEKGERIIALKCKSDANIDFTELAKDKVKYSIIAD